MLKFCSTFCTIIFQLTFTFIVVKNNTNYTFINATYLPFSYYKSRCLSSVLLFDKFIPVFLTTKFKLFFIEYKRFIICKFSTICRFLFKDYSWFSSDNK